MRVVAAPDSRDRRIAQAQVAAYQAPLMMLRPPTGLPSEAAAAAVLALLQDEVSSPSRPV